MLKSFSDCLDEFKPRVDAALNRQIAGLVENGGLPVPGNLDAAWKGGKRIRGCLLCTVSYALGGNLEDAIPRAVAIELIHAASLIHDDFVDQDALRRGAPATWTLLGARRAVLLGDVIFASAIEMMSNLSREDGLMVSGAIAQLARGALHEPLEPVMLTSLMKSEHPLGRIYDELIRLKTGILFGTACRLGAVAAGADDSLKDDLFQYGLKVGEAYQIMDDLKEVRHHLSTRRISSNKLSALMPAFFRFLKETPLEISSMLDHNHSEIGGPVLRCFHDMELNMESELKRRLDSGISMIGAGFPENGRDLLRRAPSELILVFDNSG